MKCEIANPSTNLLLSVIYSLSLTTIRRRTLLTVLRNDQYRVDSEYIVIKGFRSFLDLRVRCSRKIHISGLFQFS
jgi:hypothetical protein